MRNWEIEPGGILEMAGCKTQLTIKMASEEKRVSQTTMFIIEPGFFLAQDGPLWGDYAQLHCLSAYSKGNKSLLPYLKEIHAFCLYF